MRGQIVAMGGGGFSQEPDNPLLDDYITGLVRRDRPRICFVPTASGDSSDYLLRFYTAFPSQRFTPTHLLLFRRTVIDVRAFLLEQEIIYVGGGNTANMLAIWRRHGLDRILPEAAAAGVILCGISAGALCWFEDGLTDSFGALDRLGDGLGLLPGLFSPHLDSEPGRRQRFAALVQATGRPGRAADDGAALHFVDGHLVRTVSSRPMARGYRFTPGPNDAQQEPLPTDYLG